MFWLTHIIDQDLRKTKPESYHKLDSSFSDTGLNICPQTHKRDQPTY